MLNKNNTLFCHLDDLQQIFIALSSMYPTSAS